MERPKQTRISSRINNFKDIDEAMTKVQDMFDHVYFYGTAQHKFRIRIKTSIPVYLNVFFDMDHKDCNGDKKRGVIAAIKEVVIRFTAETKSFYYSVTAFVGDNPVEEDEEDDEEKKEDQKNVYSWIRKKYIRKHSSDDDTDESKEKETDKDTDKDTDKEEQEF